MARAANERERREQKVWLRQAAEGKLGRVTNEMKKDLRADKELYQIAVKNGVLSSPRKTTKK